MIALDSRPWWDPPRYGGTGEQYCWVCRRWVTSSFHSHPQTAATQVVVTIYPASSGTNTKLLLTKGPSNPRIPIELCAESPKTEQGRPRLRLVAHSLPPAWSAAKKGHRRMHRRKRGR